MLSFAPWLQVRSQCVVSHRFVQRSAPTKHWVCQKAAQLSSSPLCMCRTTMRRNARFRYSCINCHSLFSVVPIIMCYNSSSLPRASLILIESSTLGEEEVVFIGYVLCSVSTAFFSEYHSAAALYVQPSLLGFYYWSVLTNWSLLDMSCNEATGVIGAISDSDVGMAVVWSFRFKSLYSLSSVLLKLRYNIVVRLSLHAYRSILRAKCN